MAIRIKALLVGNFPGDKQESMLRFADALADGLSSYAVDVERIAPQKCFTRLTPRYRYDGLPKYLGYLDKFVIFPRRLRSVIRARRPSVVHLIDHASAMYAGYTGGVATLATCHDLLQIRAARGELPQQRLGKSGRRFQEWILRSIEKVPHLACVSRKTADDLQRLAPRPQDRLHVILNGLNYPYAPVAFERAQDRLARLPGASDWLNRPGGFYMSIGGAQWYKNRPGLLKIQHALLGRSTPPAALVLVGTDLSAADQQLLDDLKLQPHFFRLSNLNNETLAAVYSRARGLIFPSWEEGFGWPVAEAQACGCPVFTSNRAPLTEVGGDAAVYFDPANADAAAEAILGAASRFADMQARGLARAPFWAPSRMLQEYAQLYRRISSPVVTKV